VAFKRPNPKAVQAQKEEGEQKHGKMFFEPEEIRAMLKAARQPLLAMLLLGINGALNNSDVAHLPLTALDLEGGWLTFPRKKTGVKRRIPLWPETVQALRDWLDVRPKPADETQTGFVFLRRRGHMFAEQAKTNPVSTMTRWLLKEIGLGGHRSF